MKNNYHYNDLLDLTPAELFVWITVDCTTEQLGIQDLIGVFAIVAGLPLIPTRGKFKGATPGTSLASVTMRKYLNHELKFRVPTLTWGSMKKLKFRLTNNLGAVVGRAVPGLGWGILAYDLVIIIRNSITRYNRIVRPADQIF